MMAAGAIGRSFLPRIASFILGCFAAGWALASPLPDTVDWTASQPDLSFLNQPERPAGKRGFVHAKGDALVFDDGSPARFWGANITAASLFQTDREAVKQQARRLSRLGFNLVRLHHHDSYWVQPNIFGTRSSNTRRIDPDMLDRIDWWVHCLKEEGIYVWLDLHVQRKLTAADGIPGFEDMAKGQPAVDLKGFNYVDADIERAMQAFNEAYLAHTNPYTHLAFKDDPAVAAVLITNENDLTHHYGNALLPNQKVGRHGQRYMEEAKAFAKASGLPEDKVWKAWEYGPSKLFLNDLEQRFNARMIGHLRALGVKVPIATTSLWGWQAVSLPALTVGDVIDVHAYEEPGFLGRDPRKQGNAMHMAATAQVAGKPVTVTEWNMGKLGVPDRHELPLYVAATASHQGWDALMHYAYAQTPLQSAGFASIWHAFNDPSRLAVLPAAALLYRRHDVREAMTTYEWSPTAAQLFDAPIASASAMPLRLAAEHGRLVTRMPATPALPWLKSAAATKAVSPAQASGAANDDLTSDTAELKRDWKRATFTVDTARTQLASGAIGGRELKLGDVNIRLQTPRASVAVQSLDDKPIRESGHLLVSIATDASPAGEKDLPYSSEPVRGDIEIAAAGFTADSRQPGVQVREQQGRTLIVLNGKEVAHWLSLQRKTAVKR
jgi:hypothetical protein